MHRSIRYYPKICSIYSFGVVGASYSKYFGRVVVQKSVCNVRSHSTEPESALSVDYGIYSIILPPENAPVGIAHHKTRSVPDEIARPRYTRSNRGPIIKGEESVESRRKGKNGHLILGTDEEQRMRRACKLAKDTLEFAASRIKVGVTTDDIDAGVHHFVTSKRAYPSPLRYQGFPKSICTSVNNIVAHGIPDDRPLEDGDIMNIDVTVFLDGYHGDTSRTFAVGNVDGKGSHLLRTAQQALRMGINACGPGRPFRAIGDAIYSFIHGPSLPTAKHYSTPGNPRQIRPQCDDVIYSICTEFTGHGIGIEFHMRPWVIHTKNEEPEVMAPGDCFTIEVNKCYLRRSNADRFYHSLLLMNRQPIILQRSHTEETGIWLWRDGWTASTDNGARGAVFEHTVMITENGVDILTL